MKNYDEITNNLLSRRDKFVKTRKKRIKIVTSVSLCAVVLASALSIGLVKGGAFETKKGENNITSNNSETGSQNKKVIYVTGDSPDNYANVDDSILGLKGRYISPKLQEKMDLYKDYKEAEVIYRVLVVVINTGDYYEEGDKLADADKKVQVLYEEQVAAYLEEQKAWAEYRAFGEANPNNDPETIEKNKEFVAIIKEKEEKHDILWSKWSNLRNEIISKYVLEAKTERLKFATQYSEKEPVLVTDAYYKDWTFYMDLTAEEINILAEKGGYMFKLSSNDFLTVEIDD